FCLTLYYVFVFFFFEAEDGIRDGHVTGVQTCALPIWSSVTRNSACSCSLPRDAPVSSHCARPSLRRKRMSPGRFRSAPTSRLSRSEERRVGKECRAEWGRGE